MNEFIDKFGKDVVHSILMDVTNEKDVQKSCLKALMPVWRY